MCLRGGRGVVGSFLTVVWKVMQFKYIVSNLLNSPSSLVEGLLPPLPLPMNDPKFKMKNIPRIRASINGNQGGTVSPDLEKKVGSLQVFEISNW